jgi:hypothetical protein
MSRSALLLLTTLLAGCEYDVSGASPATDDGGASTRADAGPNATADATPGTPDAAPGTVDAATPTSPDARPVLACPDGYTLDPATGTGYRVGSFLLDWGTAEGACADDGQGTHLVVIGNAAERDHVKSLSGGQAVWIGLTDSVTEHDFVSVTSEATAFAPWALGEPNDGGLFGEDCVELRDGSYNDRGCSNLETYVCECDGRAEDPAAF